MTSCLDIAEITKVITVKSFADWKDEEARTTKRSKAAKANRFFCRQGYHEQSRLSTPDFDWNTLYTKVDRENLDDFRKKVEALITDYVKAKLPAKLSSRIKTQKKTQYVEVSPSVSSEHSSDSSATSESEESDTDYEDHIPSKRKLDYDDDLDYITTTPKKPKLASTGGTPRTPKRFTTITTPGSRNYRVSAPLEVTPLPSRVSSVAEAGLSPHQLARQRLHVAEVPMSLPCREEEFAAIYEQVESAILENESALIYVSGTPGTGKTATVREVINTLQQKVLDQELFAFKFVEINGMKIPDPAQAYSKLWEALTGQRVSSTNALALLQRQFKSRNAARTPCVVLMDELDQLTTTKQEVMYNFFQWPNMPNTRLIVIAVANTMDLPERTLAHKVSSRLGLTRIAFAAYTRPQLNEIIKARLETVEDIDVDKDAIDYACMRVSRVSGDARRALDICRRAFELAEPNFTARKATGGKVTVKIMQSAFTELTTSPVQTYLKELPFLAKLVVKALLNATRRSGVPDSTVGDVVEESTRMCKVNTHQDIPSVMGYLQPIGVMCVIRALDDAGIVTLEPGHDHRSLKIRLRVSESEVLSSWTELPDFQRIT